MKALLMTAALAATVTSAAYAQTSAELATQAAAAYAQRDYSNAGSASAQQAAELYAKAAASAGSASEKAKDLVGQSAALYFVGDVASNNGVKIDMFNKGILAADAAAATLGIPSVPSATDAQLATVKAKLSADDLATLAEGLYQRGANLGQWGQANGVVQSLGKWGELRRNMEIISVLGMKATHDYGAYRILGRGYFKIPGLLGGDVAKAKSYLEQAVSNTLVAGTVYSRNGYNNTYYAEVLNDNGDTDVAQALLEAFIAADPAQIDPTSIPELKKAQADAKELLKTF